MEAESMRAVLIGGKYRHFKGMEVEVIASAKHTETNETLIIYKHLGTNFVYARPHNMFVSKVDRTKYPDADQEYRFELVPDRIK